MIEMLEKAWANRAELFVQWESEQTDCYRLFHGTVEGLSGVTIDRYGAQCLVQSFHEPLDQTTLETIQGFYNQQFNFDIHWVYNDRSAKHSRRERSDENADVHLNLSAKELGVRYRVAARHAGEDPLLFLDLRVARRWLLEYARDKSVLNLFGYTCGVGVASAVAGAQQVWNVDFSKFALGFAEENYQLNGISPNQYQLIESDCFAALKQLAGVPIKPRMKKLPNGRRVQAPLPDYPKLAPRQFDIVFLDPPRWAKSAFGTVDLVRDYQSLFKPALLATKENGVLIACNNVAKVDRDEWCESLKRCAEKNGRPIRELTMLTPEGDFPSRDQNPPLKIAVCQL